MKSFRKHAFTAFVCACATFLVVPTIGCNTQATIAELITTVGGAVSSLESIEGNTALAQKVQADTAAASTAVLNWKSGTASQDVIAALNLVEDDLSLFPVSGTDSVLIDLAIGTVEEIITEVTGNTPSPVAAPATRKSARINMVPANTHIKNAKDFRSAWNGIVATDSRFSKVAIQ